MAPHSRNHCIQQSTNILGNCCMPQHWKWGIIAAAIGHLGHDTLTDVVGWLWVVLYVGIHRLFLSGDRQYPSDEVMMSYNEHPCWHWSCRRGSLHTKLVVVLHHPGSNIIVNWYVVAAATKLVEEEQEETILTTGEFVHWLIMGVAVVLQPPWGPTPGF